MSTSTLLVISLFSLFHLTQTRPSPSFIENDSIVFPDTDNSTSHNTISDKLNECIQDHFKIEFNGECRALLATENTCPNNKWLVLDLAAAKLQRPEIKGKCVQRRCPPQQHFWAELNRCVFSNESSSLCPKGNTIQTDFFGDGYCECVKQPVHAADATGTCYPIFTRGPCRSDGVWVKVHAQAECRSDHCGPTRAMLPTKVIVPWPDRNCYTVNERGPCKQGLVVRVNEHLHRPQCDDPLTPLHLLDPPCTATDHSGSCTQSVNTPQNQFLTQVAQQANKKRTLKGLDSPK